LACCAAGHSGKRPCSSSNPKASSPGSALALACSGAGNPGPAGEDPPWRGSCCAGVEFSLPQPGFRAEAEDGIGSLRAGTAKAPK
jgi:hypothetical protein